MNNEILIFSLFLIFIFGIIFIDLGVFNKHSHELTFKQALSWTLIWISFSIGFYFLLKFKGDLLHGIDSKERLLEIAKKYNEHLKLADLDFAQALDIYRNNMALEFITGYLVEYSLSIDNIFVIIMVFMSFGLREKFYKKVLFWGIIGAIVMRFIFIFISSTLIQNFSWILYVFGVFLVFTGIQMLVTRNKEKKIDPVNHPIVKLSSRYFNIYPKLVGERFWIYRNKKFMFTPLMIILLIIEFTDVVFAVDSVPAIFSITRDPFIVYFSNIFAILGLRSLFFLVAKGLKKLKYLKLGISALLIFVGVKMIVPHHILEAINYKTSHSLLVILVIISITVIASLIANSKEKAKLSA